MRAIFKARSSLSANLSFNACLSGSSPRIRFILAKSALTLSSASVVVTTSSSSPFGSSFLTSSFLPPVIPSNLSIVFCVSLSFAALASSF